MNAVFCMSAEVRAAIPLRFFILCWEVPDWSIFIQLGYIFLFIKLVYIPSDISVRISAERVHSPRLFTLLISAIHLRSFPRDWFWWHLLGGLRPSLSLLFYRKYLEVRSSLFGGSSPTAWWPTYPSSSFPINPTLLFLFQAMAISDSRVSIWYHCNYHTTSGCAILWR